MKKLCVFALLGGLVLQSAIGATDLKQSKFTQVINSVEVISSSTRHAAAVNDVFEMPDVLRTGTGSRAELIANDGTLTRVGANTIFSFDPAERTIDLQQGSLLFHSPHGKGGGTIRTGSATASVIGTTIIVTTTPNGGFKVLDLEGEAEVRFLNGLKETLAPGQMTFILPGGGSSPIIVFRLDVETQGSLLVSGFNNPLPSWPQIQAEITRQLTLLLDGRVVDTDFSVGDNATPQTVQVVMNIISSENKPPLSNASIIGSDHTANQPLPQNYTPLDAKHTMTGPFTPPGNFSEGLTFLGLTTPQSGFVGNNIVIDTADIDLSSFAGKSDFDIMAQNNLQIWQSLNFGTIEESEISSSSLPETVALFAGGQMEIAQGARLEANTGTFGLVAGSFATLDTEDGSVSEPGTLDGVSVRNYDGDVDILSQSDLTWDDFGYVYAGGDVDIQSDGSLTLGSDESETTLDDGHDFVVDAEGSISLNAENDLTLNHAEADAYNGEIDLNSFDGNIKMEDYSDLYAYDSINLDADNNVTITRGYLDAGEDVNITTGGSVEAAADDTVSGGDININYSTIEAGDSGFYEDGDDVFVPGGSVYINAGGNLMLCSDTVEAYSGDDSETGNVNIYAYNGTADVYNTYIYADNTVDIESGDTLTLNSDGSEQTVEGFNGVSLTSDYGDVDANNYDIEADFGDVDVTADNGNVNLTEDTIYAGSEDTSEGYDADIFAGEDVSIIEGTTINASGNVCISADGSLSATADGTESLGSGAIDIEDSYINAGDGGTDSEGSVYIKADNGGINLNDDEIYTYSDGTCANVGAIKIDAADNVIIDDSDVEATGNVNITAGGSISEDEIDTSSGSSAEVDIEDSDISAGYNDGTSSFSGGSVCITANNGDVYLNDDGVDAYSGDTSNGNIKIYATGNVGVVDDTTLQADGNVYITSGGSEEDLSLDSSSSGFGDVNVDCSDIYAGYDGDAPEMVCINAGGNVSIKHGSEVYATGDVDINAGQDATEDGIDAPVSVGNIDIDHSDIEAGYDSSSGGNVNINADTGDVCLEGDEYCNGIYAYSDGNTEEGNVNIYAYGTGDVENTDIYADDQVSIETGDTLTMNNDGSEQTVEGFYGVSLTSDYGDVDANNYEVEADQGDVSISAGESSGSGNVNLTEDFIYAGSNDSDAVGYDVDIFATEDVSVTEGTTINASGNVCISADGSLSATADGTSEGSAAIDIEDSYINAGYSCGDLTEGSVYIDADNGGINLYDDRITAYSDGSCAYIGTIKIGAADNVIIDSGTDLEATGNVNINAGGSIEEASIDTSSDSCATIDIEDAEISAGDNDGTSSLSGGSVCITANNGDVYLNDDGVDAYSGDTSNGNIKIYATGNVGVVDGTDLDADGNVYITSGGSEEDLSLDSSSSGYGDVDINCSDIYAGEDTDVSEMVCIDAGGNVTIKHGSEVYATGDVDINAGEDVSSYGNVDISHSDIEAGYDSSSGGNVNINADTGDVCLEGDEYCNGIEAYSDDNTEEGNVNIYAYGTADVEDTSIYADDQVSIESGCSLTLNNSGSEQTVEGYEGVSLTSDYSDVDVNVYNIEADQGDVDITAGESSDCGNVNLNEAYIYAGSEAYDCDYDVDISAAGDVSAVTGTTINASGNVYISADGSLAADSDSGTGAIYIADTTINAGYSCENLTEGSVYINADNGGINLFDDEIRAYSDGSVPSVGSINIGAANNVVINTGTYVEATGDVNITAGESVSETELDTFSGSSSEVDIEDSDIYAGAEDYSASDSGGSINIKAKDGSAYLNDDGIYAYSGAGSDGNITIAASQNVGVEDSYVQGDGDVHINAGQSFEITSLDSSSGDGDVDIGNSEIYAGFDGDFGGSADITAGGNVSIEDGSEVYAYDDVTIDAGEAFHTSGAAPLVGSIDIEDSDIEAGFDASCNNPSFDGGNVVMNAYSGNVYLNDDTVYAHAGDSSDGDISVYADGNIDVLYSTLGADGETTVTANNGYVNVYDSYESGNLCMEYWDISAGTYVSIGADNNININNSSITALGGDVSISAGGSLSIESGDDFNSISGNNVNLTAYDSVSVDGEDITAGNGNVTITSGDGENEPGENVPTSDNDNSPDYVSFNQSDITPDNTYDMSDVYNPQEGVSLDLTGDGVTDEYTGNIDLEAGVGVTITDLGLIGETGDVQIIADDGDVDIESSPIIQALNGNVYITAHNGTVTVNDSDLEADDGNVAITADADVDISDSTLNASEDVSITSNDGMVMIDDGNTEVNDGSYNIYAGDSISINGDCVSVQDTAMYAQDELDITSSGGNVDLDNVSLTTYYDDIDIDAQNGTLTLDQDSSENNSLEAGGSIELTGDDGVDISDSGIYADDGDIQVSSWGTEGGISISDSDLEAYGNVCISSDGDICITDNDSEDEGIYTDSGNINIVSTEGDVYVNDSDIEANGDVSISSGETIDALLIGPAPGSVDIMDSDVDADSGSVYVNAGGTIMICDSEVSAGYNVLMESGGALVLINDNPDFDSGIYANNTVSLTSDDCDVDIYGTYIDANGGMVQVTANNGDVDIENSEIDVSDSSSISLSISDDSSVTASGNVYITANGGTVDIAGEFVNITDTTFGLGGNISISGSDITAQDGDVDILTTGTLSISGEDSLNGVEVDGGSISVCDSDITADSGNVNIENQFSSPGGVASDDSDITISDSDITATESGTTGGNITISTPGNITVEGSTLQASADINIGSGGELELKEVETASGYGDVNIDNSDLYAGNNAVTGGSVYINAGGNVTVNSSDIEAGDADILSGVDETIAGGNVNVHSFDGNVSFDDDAIIANSGSSFDGDIIVHANGNICALDSDLDADGSVTLTADNGYVNVTDSLDSSDLDVNDWDIQAGTYVDLTADDTMQISDSSITANGGDVNITADGSTVVPAVVPLGSVAPAYDITIEDGTSIEASDSVNVTAENGNIDINDSTLTADSGNVNISAGATESGNVLIENGSTISGDDEVNITAGNSGGNVDIESSTITAASGSTDAVLPESGEYASSLDITAVGGTISINAGNDVTLNNDTFNLGGEVDIAGYDYTVDSGDVDITADGSLSIDAGGTVEISNPVSGSGIVGASIDITGTTITANAGNVNLDAGENITVGNSTISATDGGSDVSITESGTYNNITAIGGTISVTAGGNVTLDGTFDVGGDVDISSDSTITASSGDLDVTAEGALTVSAGGAIDTLGNIVNGGNINVTGGVTLASIEGNVNLNAGENVNVQDSDINAFGNVNITAGGTVDIASSDTMDTSITSDGTDNNSITVNAGSGLTVSGAALTADPSTGTVALNNTSGDVNINNGTTIHAAYLTVNSGDGILIDGSSGGSFTGTRMSLKTAFGTAADDTTGAHTVSVQNADLSGFTTVDIQAHTVNLNNDNFSSSSPYNFTSFHTGYYINSGSTAGYVNFNNDTLNGSTAIVNQGTAGAINQANNGGIELGGTGAGIHITGIN